MVNHDGREWKQIAGIASDRDQLYLAHAQCWMKKRVTGGRKRPMKSSSAQHPNGRIVHEEKKREQSGGYGAGEATGTKNMKEIYCKRKTAVRHADVAETRRADKSKASCESEVALKSRGQSCGCAGACTCKCNNMHARECEHNKHDVRARACLHVHTVASRMCTC